MVELCFPTIKFTITFQHKQIESKQLIGWLINNQLFFKKKKIIINIIQITDLSAKTTIKTGK